MNTQDPNMHEDELKTMEELEDDSTAEEFNDANGVSTENDEELSPLSMPADLE